MIRYYICLNSCWDSIDFEDSVVINATNKKGGWVGENLILFRFNVYPHFSLLVCKFERQCEKSAVQLSKFQLKLGNLFTSYFPWFWLVIIGKVIHSHWLVGFDALFLLASLPFNLTSSRSTRILHVIGRARSDGYVPHQSINRPTNKDLCILLFT